MKEASSSLKGIVITILTSLGLAWGYNLIGINGNGEKIKDPENGKEYDDILRKKELEIKEKELEIRMKELESKIDKASPEKIHDALTSANLSGEWQGNNGNRYEISQSGNKITFREYLRFLLEEYVSSTGTGILTGNSADLNGFGILGQEIKLKLDVLGQDQVSLSGVDFNGNVLKILLSKSPVSKK